MRKRRTIILATIIFVCLGIAAIIIGIFAYHLGLDNNAVMGSKRKLLIALGIALLLVSPAIFIFRKLYQRWDLGHRIRDFQSRLVQSKLIMWSSNLVHNYQNNRFNQFFRSHSWIWSVFGSVLVILVSIWYLTSGTFRLFTPYSSYYDRQADAFIAGQLSLLEAPPKELAQLSNVYNFENRVGIHYLWDVSYFQGKYYLYWGPVPALVALGIKLFHPGVIEDQILVLLFVSGLTIALSALFYWIRKTYFASTPGWTIFLFTLTGILCTPVFWLITRPSVYEAAIASAQFFLILGVYGAIRAISSPGRKESWLILAGFCLGFAVGSRFTYVFSVIFLSLVICLPLFNGFKSRPWKIYPLLSFMVPLTVIAAGLAWFNFARFGNVFETGIRYQLTGIALPSDFKKVFSLSYVVPNVYSSVIRPFKFSPSEFPFFFAPYIGEDMWPNFIYRPPTYYSTEPVVGVLSAIPFLWMLAVPLVKLGRRAMYWINETPQPLGTKDQKKLPILVIVLIAGGTFCLFLTMMCFVMSTMRYLADFVPMLTLLTAIIVWQAYEQLLSKPGWRKFLLFVTFILCTFTIAIGLLINMQNGDKRFKTNNPVLYAEIANFFTK